MLERLKRASLRGRAEFASKYGSNPAHLILLVPPPWSRATR